MPTWAIRFVRLDDRTTGAAQLALRAGPDVAIHDDGKSPFLAWSVEPPGFEPPDLSDLSREFGEALGLAVQTVADLVVYDHFVRGERTRGLTYAGDAGWVRVTGEAEPWEAPLFFASARLLELSDALADEFTEDVLEREQAELERLWKVARLEPGGTRPPAEPLAVARAITRHFHLPAMPRVAKT